METREFEQNPSEVVQGLTDFVSGDDSTLQLSPFVEPESVEADPIHVEVEHVGKLYPTKTLKTSAPTKIDVKKANFWYGTKQALKDVSIPLLEGQVTALIGPSGCGKSTFVRTLNRMNDLVPGSRGEG